MEQSYAADNIIYYTYLLSTSKSETEHILHMKVFCFVPAASQHHLFFAASSLITAESIWYTLFNPLKGSIGLKINRQSEPTINFQLTARWFRHEKKKKKQNTVDVYAIYDNQCWHLFVKSAFFL